MMIHGPVRRLRPQTKETKMSFGFSNLFGASSKPAKGISAADAVKLAEEGAITVIDVRDHSEIAQTGKAKGALHIPLFQLQQKADPRHPEFHQDLSTEKPVAVYCASGARSEMARRALAGFGFGEVHNIGGFFHWQSAGGVCEA